MCGDIFKQPNGSRIIVMYVKLLNRTCRPQQLKAGLLIPLHWTYFCVNFSDHNWHQLFLLSWKRKLIFHIWLARLLFDILHVPFSLEHIIRLYLFSTGIFCFCFKDYLTDRMSTCFHISIAEKKKRKTSVASDGAQTKYSKSFVTWHCFRFFFKTITAELP